MKKILFLFITSAVINLSLSAQGTSQVAYRFYSHSKTSITQTDEQAIRSLIATLETGWNNKSGATFSSAFADIHDYIVVNGMYFPNWSKKGNEAAHQNLFDGVYKNLNIKLKIDKITFLRPDLSYVTVFGASYEKEASVPEDPGTIMTILSEKKNDTWKIISFHNHNLEANIKDRSPMPLTVMYASWYKK